MQSFPRAHFFPLAFLLLAILPMAGCGGTDPPAESPAEPTADGPASVAPPVAAVDRAALPAEPDLLLITIDTLRYDSLGFTGGHDSTPTLDRLAETGRTFTRAYAHNVVTLPSHANILTGLYPYQHGVRDNSGFTLSEDVPTLASLLRDAGFATAAFVAAFPLDARFGLGHGFDVYDDQAQVGGKLNEFAVDARPGDQVVSRALRWWKEHAGQRRFLWLHLYDPHAPYAPPAPFDERYATDPYRGEVAAVDRYLEPVLGPILDGAEPNTLVMLTSDHGEALGDHGELTHGLFAYQATVHVPLVLWGAGIVPGEDARTVGHVDLLPTVLDLFGIASPPQLAGISLASGAAVEREVYFEALSAYLNRGWAPLYGLVRGDAKYIRLPVPELYDLAADPAEAENLIPRENASPEARQTYRSLRDALPAAAVEAPSRRLIPEDEAQKLRALGYLASNAAAKSRFTEADDPKNLIVLDRKIHQLTVMAGDGRLQEAVELGYSLVAERPEMSLTYLRLSPVLRELGRFSEAVKLLRGALASGLEQPALVRELGLTLAEAGAAQEAIILLEPLAGSADLKTLNALGVAYFAAGRLQDARRVLENVLERDSDNLRALESLGAVALRGEDPPMAIRYLERALAVNPDLPIAWNTLGVARKWSEDVEGALEAWERAVALDPNLIDAWYNLGRVALDSSRWATARRAFEEYVARAPEERFPAEVDAARRLLERLPKGP